MALERHLLADAKVGKLKKDGTPAKMRTDAGRKKPDSNDICPPFAVAQIEQRAFLMKWVKLKKYCEVSGETPDSIKAKRRAGHFIDGIQGGLSSHLRASVAQRNYWQRIGQTRRKTEDVVLINWQRCAHKMPFAWPAAAKKEWSHLAHCVSLQNLSAFELRNLIARGYPNGNSEKSIRNHY